MAAARPCHHRTCFFTPTAPTPAGTPPCARAAHVDRAINRLTRRRTSSRVFSCSSRIVTLSRGLCLVSALVLRQFFHRTLFFQPRGRPHASRTRVIDRSSASTHPFPSRDSMPSACIPITADRITADITPPCISLTPQLPDRFLHCHDLHPTIKTVFHATYPHP